MHVRYKSLYISLPFSAKQQREMTKVGIFWRKRTTAGNFSYFRLVPISVAVVIAKAPFCRFLWRLSNKRTARLGFDLTSFFLKDFPAPGYHVLHVAKTESFPGSRLSLVESPVKLVPRCSPVQLGAQSVCYCQLPL